MIKFRRIFFLLYSGVIRITEKGFNKRLAKQYEKLLINNQKRIIILDIGAHFGETIAFFEHNLIFDKIISIEPSRISFANLEKQHINSRNKTLINAAIGEKSGELDFFESAITEMSSLIPPSDIGIRQKLKKVLFRPDKSSMSQYKVPVLTIDELLVNENLKNSLLIIKIDTEGYELQALLGAMKTLTLNNKIVLQIEIHRDRTRKHLESKIHLLLASKGYKNIKTLSHYIDPTVKDKIYVKD